MLQDFRMPELEWLRWKERLEEWMMNFSSEAIVKQYRLRMFQIAELKRQQKTVRQDSPPDLELIEK